MARHTLDQFCAQECKPCEAAGANCAGAEHFQGIQTQGVFTISSEAGETTKVDENRILARDGVQIYSGRRTRVIENNFSDSGDVVIQGPRCRARDNIRNVNCRP